MVRFVKLGDDQTRQGEAEDWLSHLDNLFPMVYTLSQLINTLVVPEPIGLPYGAQESCSHKSAWTEWASFSWKALVDHRYTNRTLLRDIQCKWFL